ncbi:hypothetical protein GOV04_04505 [Candidatus Woesearchaeota archaeon]|nr:hypothetical protein [Candidatus Woesearchaeota archaeon]
MSSTKYFLIFCTLLMLVPFSLGADDYKPYLHTPKLPDSPQVRLFGQYATNLFPGSATYSYPIETPRGVNGLRPTIFIFYNSQIAKQRPGILGAGWSLNQDLIYRDVNSTPDSTSDDKYIMVLDGNLYELIYSGGEYKTEVDYWFKIEKNTSYWIVTKQDGTKYRFGQELDSNTGRSYTLKWFLDQVEDTHSNKLYYTYSEDPNAEDSGAVYLDKIEYNSDKKRVINFTYENTVRPDRRRVYEQANILEESRRLTNIAVIVDDQLVRKYDFDYTLLTPSLSTLSEIALYGSSGNSTLYNITFDYHVSTDDFTKDTSSWNPPTTFSSGSDDHGARLLDLNNDGFVDIVQRKSGTNKAWLNDKTENFTEDNSWTVPYSIVSATYADEGVRFADINKDGYIDFLKSKAGTRSVYLNTGSGWNSSSWTIPVDFVDSSGVDQGVRIIDVNGDARADIIKSKSGVRTVYLNTGSGWGSTGWSIPIDFVDGSGDTAARLVDINGDGLTDILQGDVSTKKAWLNNGAGWTNYDSTWEPPTAFITGSNEDDGVRFGDVNNDGLVDILDQSSNAWLNTGNGWQQNNSWTSPEDFISSGKNIGRRLADVNADGLIDIVVSHDTSKWVQLKDYALPYMLNSINNEYGGITTLNYTTSTQFNNTNLGFNIFVVSQVTKNNSITNDFNIFASTTYEYALGKYNYDKQEFRGFGIATESNTDSVVKHYFYQDDPRRGKEYKTEVYDLSSNIYFKNVKDYNYTLKNKIYNLSLKTSTDYIYDGLQTPVVRNVSYEYNVFGNPQLVNDHGDVSVIGDEKYYNYSYGFNFEDWIIDKVSRATVYDADMNKVKETKYYYDYTGLNGVGTLGELTKTEEWLENGNNSYTHFEYDTYGNLVSRIDSLSNVYKYRYDDLNIFVESIVNPLGHVSTYSYDAGTGNLLYEEKNGIRTSYSYDIFGRIISEIRPYDSSSLPTKNYEYDFDGNAPEKITVKLKTTANNTDDVNYFYDGFANLVQLKTTVESGQEVVKNIFYDSEFRVDYEQNPYFNAYSSGLTSKSSTSNITTYNYDAMGRVVQVVNPDGTNKTVSFSQYDITDYDENGYSHTYTLDSHDRIIKVIEYNQDSLTGLDENYETTYEYDANDNLIKITDNEQNEFIFEYDELSRKTQMTDPDMGTWTYKYNTNGNLISQIDNKDNEITLSYDGLNRIVSKTSSDVSITFGYDIDYYGTLSNISTTDNIVLNYDYDNRLRVVKETQTIDGGSFDNVFLYDSSDRIVKNNDLEFTYNKQGLVEQILDFVTGSDYNAFGSIIIKGYQNTLITNYSYDSKNNRLLSINSPNVQSLSYNYDNAGNILSINDSVSSTFYSMTYDYLDRLGSATIGPDVYVYSYNSIGNILKIVKNNNSKKFAYGNLAHAPSKIVDGLAGVDLHNPHEIDTNSKTRVFEFYLVNELDNAINTNFSVAFDDDNSFDSEQISLSDSMIVLVEKNYTSGGDYKVNFSAYSNGTSDFEAENTKFGVRALDMKILFSNITRRTFEFVFGNDVEEQINNVDWNCSESLSAAQSVNIVGNNNVSTIIDYYYTGPGSKTFACTATSNDGTETITKDFTIKGLEVVNYDVLYANTSRRIIEFNARNNYHTLNTNVLVDTNEESFSDSLNIEEATDAVFITEINYSTDGPQEYKVSMTANGSTSEHVERFLIKGVSIENYAREENNFTNQILMFDIVNNWVNGNVSWNITNPDVNSTAYLQSGESIAVIVENTYTTQGNNLAIIQAKTSAHTDTITDLLQVKPLQLIQFEALTTSVFEIIARNNLNTPQQIDWQFDGVNSETPVNITSDDAYIIIEKTYATGLHELTTTINSSNYNDTQEEVIVV